MRDIVDGLAAWRAAGLRCAVATVVRTWKSAPRQPGAAMAVCETGEVLGSVSGGCVESAVYELALGVLESGEPVLQTYGVGDDDAFAVGLTCGGVIEVLVQPMEPATLDRIVAAVADRRPMALVSPLDHGVGFGRPVVVPCDDLDLAVAERAAGMLTAGETGVADVGEARVFVRSFAPPPRMLIFGAIDFATAVARIGKFLGYHVTVCDARPIFATALRFPEADEVVVRWPHDHLDSIEVDARTVICVLTHDPKFDVPLLERALRTPARYVGAMGSRGTHGDRMRRLRERGVPESSLARLSSPIGLDLGAHTPEETAVSIAAEIVASARGGSGLPLTGLDRPIHGGNPLAGDA